MQQATRGKILLACIVDGGKCRDWTPEKGWREMSSLNVAFAGLHGSGKLLGNSPALIAALLLQADNVRYDNAPELIGATCTSTTDACETFEARIEKNEIGIKLDPARGVIRQMVTENSLIHSTADIEAYLDIPFDFGRVVGEVLSHPDEPMTIKELRGRHS